jgi:hypothetical protein
VSLARLTFYMCPSESKSEKVNGPPILKNKSYQVMKNLWNKIKNKFVKKESIYGSGIFCQQTWISKQVQEALRKRAYNLD